MLLSSGWLPGTVIFWNKGMGHWTINLVLPVLMLKAQAQIDQVNAHLVLHHPEGNCSRPQSMGLRGRSFVCWSQTAAPHNVLPAVIAYMSIST